MQSTLDIKSKRRCLNCGVRVQNNYCSHCGQKQDDHRLSIKQFTQNAFTEYWSLDNRVYHTFKLLFFNPGELSIQWWKGKRKSYLPPLRLYLIVSVIYFFVLNFTQANTFFAGTIKMDSESGAIFQKWLPRILFILMPLFAAALKILHRKHNRYYVEHLVFALHIYSFFFIIDAIRTLLIFSFGFDELNLQLFPIILIAVLMILTFLPLLYLGAAMKKAYPQSLGSLVIRLVVLMAGYLVTALAIVGAVIYYITRF